MDFREHVKQTDQSWGAPTGEAEWSDEKAGEADAKKEEQEGVSGWDGGAAGENPAFADAGATTTEEHAPAAEPEPEHHPEDSTKSYADYLAEQAAKKTEYLGVKEARQPNEGGKENKKWKGAKELTKDGDDAEYFQGGEAKARRDRDRMRNAKERVEIDYSFKEQPREGRGGGRGRGPRRSSDRGEGSDYRGRGRGDYSGRARGEAYRPRGDRADYRGRGGRGRPSDGPAVAMDDETAFPSLGAAK